MCRSHRDAVPSLSTSPIRIPAIWLSAGGKVITLAASKQHNSDDQKEAIKCNEKPEGSKENPLGDRIPLIHATQFIV